MSAGTRPDRAWLSFRRIADVPFATCVAALESGSYGPARTARRPWPGLRAGRARPGRRDLPGPGPPGPRAAAPAAADEAAGRPLVLPAPADRAGTDPLRARPAQRRLLPGRPPAAGLAGPLAGTTRAGAAPGPRRRQPATRGPGPGCSPVTNTMPIIWHGLQHGPGAEPRYCSSSPGQPKMRAFGPRCKRVTARPSADHLPGPAPRQWYRPVGCGIREVRPDRSAATGNDTAAPRSCHHGPFGRSS